MKRKLISQGMGGYTITLPIKWIEQHNLKKGTELDLSETEDGLLITSSLNKSEKSLSIDVTEYGQKMVINVLCQAYRLGYDIIKITCLISEQQKYILSFVSTELLGFEAIDNKKVSSKITEIIFQNIAEPEAEKFDIILRRMFLQGIELSNLILSQLEQNKCSDEELSSLSLQINKMTNYLRRTLLRKKIRGNRFVLLYSIISLFSLIVHDYTYLQKIIVKKNKKINKNTLELIKQSNKMFRDFYESFYVTDKIKMHLIGEQKLKLFELIDKQLETSKNIDSIALSYLKEIIRLIQSCTTYCIGYNL